MDDQHPSTLKAQFLIAMPGLLDPNFYQTVTCICEHTAEGAFGLIINRLHPSLFAREIFNELNITFSSEADRIPIYMGGPVHFDEIFILHGPPFGWVGCFQVSPTLALSNTKDILNAISRGEGPERAVIALGCAGWGPGQLEAEIVQNAWLTEPAFDDIIFNTPVDERWSAAVKKMGIDPALLTNAAGHA